MYARNIEGNKICITFSRQRVRPIAARGGKWSKLCTLTITIEILIMLSLLLISWTYITKINSYFGPYVLCINRVMSKLWGNKNVKRRRCKLVTRLFTVSSWSVVLRRDNWLSWVRESDVSSPLTEPAYQSWRKRLRYGLKISKNSSRTSGRTHTGQEKVVSGWVDSQHVACWQGWAVPLHQEEYS